MSVESEIENLPSASAITSSAVIRSVSLALPVTTSTEFANSVVVSSS